jgi:hypothetical protein
MAERVQMGVFHGIEAVTFEAPMFVHRRSDANGNSLLDGHCNSGLAKHHSVLSKQDALSGGACFYQHLYAARCEPCTDASYPLLKPWPM